MNSSFCEVCHSPATYRCSGCHQTPYCSVECQKKDWPQHSGTHLLIEGKTRRSEAFSDPGTEKRRRAVVDEKELEIVEQGDRITTLTKKGVPVVGSCEIRVLFVYFPGAEGEKRTERVLLFENEVDGTWGTVGGGYGDKNHHSKETFPLDVVAGKESFRGIFDNRVRDFVRQQFPSEYAVPTSLTFHRLAAITGVSRTFIDKYQILTLIVRVDPAEKEKVFSGGQWFGVNLEGQNVVEGLGNDLLALGLENTLMRVFRYDAIESLYAPRPKSASTFYFSDRKLPKDAKFFEEYPWHLYMNGPALFTAEKLDEMMKEIYGDVPDRPCVMDLNHATDSMIVGNIADYYIGFDVDLRGSGKWFFHGTRTPGGLLGASPMLWENFLTPYYEMTRNFSKLDGYGYAYTLGGHVTTMPSVLFCEKSYGSNGFAELRDSLFGRPGDHTRIGVAGTKTFHEVAGTFMWPVTTLGSGAIFSPNQPRDMSEDQTYGPPYWLQLYTKVVGIVSRGKAVIRDEPQIILPAPLEDYFTLHFYRPLNGLNRSAWVRVDLDMKYEVDLIRLAIVHDDFGWILDWMNRSLSLVPMISVLLLSRNDGLKRVIFDGWQDQWFEKKKDGYEEILKFIIACFALWGNVAERMLEYVYSHKRIRRIEKRIPPSLAVVWYAHQRDVFDFADFVTFGTAHLIDVVIEGKRWEACLELIQNEQFDIEVDDGFRVQLFVEICRAFQTEHLKLPRNDFLTQCKEQDALLLRLLLKCHAPSRISLLFHLEDVRHFYPNTFLKAIEVGVIQSVSEDYLASLTTDQILSVVRPGLIDNDAFVQIIEFFVNREKWDDIRQMLERRSIGTVLFLLKESVFMKLLRHVVLPFHLYSSIHEIAKFVAKEDELLYVFFQNVRPGEKCSVLLEHYLSEFNVDREKQFKWEIAQLCIQHGGTTSVSVLHEFVFRRTEDVLNCDFSLLLTAVMTAFHDSEIMIFIYNVLASVSNSKIWMAFFDTKAEQMRRCAWKHVLRNLDWLSRVINESTTFASLMTEMKLWTASERETRKPLFCYDWKDEWFMNKQNDDILEFLCLCIEFWGHEMRDVAVRAYQKEYVRLLESSRISGVLGMIWFAETSDVRIWNHVRTTRNGFAVDYLSVFKIVVKLRLWDEISFVLQTLDLLSIDRGELIKECLKDTVDDDRKIALVQFFIEKWKAWLQIPYELLESRPQLLSVAIRSGCVTKIPREYIQVQWQDGHLSDLFFHVPSLRVEIIEFLLERENTGEQIKDLLKIDMITVLHDAREEDLLALLDLGIRPSPVEIREAKVLESFVAKFDVHRLRAVLQKHGDLFSEYSLDSFDYVSSSEKFVVLKDFFSSEGQQ